MTLVSWRAYMTPPHPKVVHETCSQVEVGRCVCRFLRQLGLCVEEGLPSGLVGNVCRNHVQPLARSAWCTRILYKGMRHMWLSEFTAILLVGKKGLRCLVWLAMAEGVHTSLRRRTASNVFYTACILDTFPKCWSIIDFKIFELNILKWLSDSIIANACLRNFNFEIPLKIDKDIVVEII